jgi:hypothetical protein
MTDLELTAYHEAGHAVACLAQGLLLKSVSVARGPDSRGRVLSLGLYDYRVDLPAGRYRREMDRIARRLLLMKLAGPAAEVAFDDDWWNIPGMLLETDVCLWPKDFLDTFRLTPDCRGTDADLGEDARRRYLWWWWHRARRFVDRHWGEIEALARALCGRKVLDEKAARAVTGIRGAPRWPARKGWAAV